MTTGGEKKAVTRASPPLRWRFVLRRVRGTPSCHPCIATTTQASAQNTQYSMPPITQIQLLVTL